jgi:peptidoglycan/xylan/chitin deacetylase (PgdA/CDA1 family)
MKKINLLVFTVLLLRFCSFASAAGNPFAGKFFAEGDRKKAEFALTFDDGPGAITEDLLALLEKRQVKAAFFVLGSSARSYPARVKKIMDAGHLVASHTDTHKNWFKIGKSAGREAVLEGELKKSADAIQKACGSPRPAVLRMPNGYDKPWVRQAAGKLGYTLVNWTYGSDWTKTSEEKMTAEYLKAVKPGAILLLHDGGGKVKEKNLRIVAAILDEAAKKGLKPVRLDDLLGLRDPLKK